MAHYLATRMIKLKSQNLGGIQKHNQREYENHSNKDINLTRSHLNYDLLNKDNIVYRDRIMRNIDNQRVSERKIRKDAVLTNEFFVTSSKKFFEELSPDEQKRFFESSTEWFQKRYGEQNITYAMVHNDETTPHMHIGVIPMKDGKLQGKNVFNRAELLHIQQHLPKFLEDKGFDIKRGEDQSKNHHVQPEDWKREQEQVRKEVLELRKEKELLSPEVANLSDSSVSLKQDVEMLVREKNSLEVENERVRASLEVESEEIKPLPFKPYGKKENGAFAPIVDSYVMIERDDLDYFNSISQNTMVIIEENEQLREENEQLKEKVTFLEKVQEQLKQTVQTARKRLSHTLSAQGVTQDVHEMFNQAMTFAHKFYSKKNEEVGSFIEKDQSGMFDDGVGAADFEKWNTIREEQKRKEEFNRGFER